MSKNSKNTIDSILETFEKWSKEKGTIDVNLWLQGCAKMTVLLEDEQVRLFLIEQKLAQKKLELIESGSSVAKAKIQIETMDEFVEMRKIVAKIERVTELIRISKLQARMSDDNMKNYR